MSRGWQGDRQRHVLAKKGIRTSGDITVTPRERHMVVPTLQTIMKAIKMKKGDVCQVGVALADGFSRTEQEYEDLWRITQEQFNPKMEGKPYTLKPEVEEEYAVKLQKAFKRYNEGTYVFQPGGVEGEQRRIE